MRSFLSLVALAALAAAQDSVRFGPYYSLGATTSYIIEAETTLYPGAAPSPQQDRMVLWPGMGTDAGALVQSIVGSFADPGIECGGEAGQWCVFASLYTGTQESGDEVPVDDTAGITINYKYDESTGTTTQTVTVDGTVISTLESNSGKAIGWGTAVECQDACSGIVNAHSYKNTTITLGAADTSFGNTLAVYNATASELTTSDGGITWTVDDIKIKEAYFEAI